MGSDPGLDPGGSELNLELGLTFSCEHHMRPFEQKVRFIFNESATVHVRSVNCARLACRWWWGISLVPPNLNDMYRSHLCHFNVHLRHISIENN